uniref:Uncharacterized protein n=1 Tax=Romanomermis culicivorax TaxID=13658 RepID=A0A915L7F6_ROMCU
MATRASNIIVCLNIDGGFMSDETISDVCNVVPSVSVVIFLFNFKSFPYRNFASTGPLTGHRKKGVQTSGISDSTVGYFYLSRCFECIIVNPQRALSTGID